MKNRHSTLTAAVMATMLALSPMTSSGLAMNEVMAATTSTATPSKVVITKAVKAVTDAGKNRVTIKWQAATNATEYRLYYKVKGTSSWKKIKTVAGTKVKATHTDCAKFPIKDGVTYLYTVRAYNEDSGKLGAVPAGIEVAIPAKAPQVQNLYLSRSSMEMTERGGIVQLAFSIAPGNADYNGISWSSSNPNVATVDPDGSVTAVNSGTAVITAKPITNYACAVSASCTVKVKVPVSTKPGDARITNIKKVVTSTGKNKVTITWNKAENATEYRLYYRTKGSSWKKIKTVDASKITTSHTSSTKLPINDEVTYQYTVRSYNANTDEWGTWDTVGKDVLFPSKAPTQAPDRNILVEDIELDSHAGYHYLDEGSFKLDVKIYPDNATDKSMRYESSDPSVATVSSDGTVTMKKYGHTRINIYANGGNSSTYYGLTVIDLEAEAQRIIELTNEERIKAGRQPLKYSPVLQEYAMMRAEDLEIKFSHDRPDGSEKGVNYAENIAEGYSTETVVQGWMNSSGHKATIMNPQELYIGVGVHYSKSGRSYFVQEFSTFNPDQLITLVLDNKGGTGPTSFVIHNGQQVTQKDLPIPERSGYTFKGWASYNSIFKSINFYAPEVLTAVWEPTT